MFVSDTFLSSFDRLSVKSTLTGKTGTLFGIFGTIAFIIVSFVIFIGPTIFYFKGDYIQGTFSVFNDESLQLYTGCDLKLAISFYSKLTGEVANHTAIKKFLNTQVLYISPDQTKYYAEVLSCDNNYFSQMEKTHDFKTDDCYIVPDGLGYKSKTVDLYTSVFGFQFMPQCPNPFLCTYGQASSSQLVTQMFDFFTNYYYVLRFTANYLDEQGNKKRKFYQMYSTQFSGKNVKTPLAWTLVQTQKMYLDNSIMPWYNNETFLFTEWLGLTRGSIIEDINLQTGGTAALVAILPNQRINYRQYKKLDWLIGMLGGGILLLFIIFWAPCNFISNIKQKYQNCISTTLIRTESQDIHNLTSPKFTFLWFVSNLLPCKLKCFSRENKIMHGSQKLLDIVQLIKKMKVAKNNLKLGHYKVKFQQRTLKFSNLPERTTFTEQQMKYQINQQTLAKIRSKPQIPKIYSNNLQMLALYSNNQQTQSIKKQMSAIMSMQIYSKQTIPKFVQDVSRSRCSIICRKIKKFFSWFIKLFDVFGAKPMLIGNKQSFSVIGCLLTLLILVTAILTFALTLKNMGVIRKYWDQVYINPENQTMSFITGDKFRALICSTQLAFMNNLVTGQNRVVDYKFYQYERNGTSQHYTYFPVQSMARNPDNYFDSLGSYYSSSTFNFTYCFKPQNGNQIKVYGDQHTESQAYFGFILTPVCLGTLSYCQSQLNTTNSNFWNFLNNFPIFTQLPTAQYFPDVEKIIINPLTISFSSITTQVTLNFTQSIEAAIFGNSLQIIDDWASWIMGDYPKPSIKMLSFQAANLQTRYKSVNSTSPYFRQKFIPTGRVNRFVFTSYKIDFLFATIGGCFAFYYFFFGCFGKAFNNYKIKVKLAEILYDQASTFVTGFKSFLKWLRIPCCRDEVLAKIQNDLDCTTIAKNTDNIYRLSTERFSSPLEKNLSLIYLKEIIKADETIAQQVNNDDISQDDNPFNFEQEWQMRRYNQRSKLNSHPKNATINEGDENEISNSIKQKQSQLQNNEENQIESVQQIIPTIRSEQKCGKFLNWFDLFHKNSQLTLDGKREIRSVCGGLFCIMLLIFICVLTSHFLTVYFSDWHQVSLNKLGDQSQKRKMHFETGTNFKIAVSFLKPDSFHFFNVSSLVQGVGMSIVKYKVTRQNGQTSQTSVQTFDLQPCSPNYFDGFMIEFDKNQFFTELDKAYCAPDNLNLSLYGSAPDLTRQYFSLKIYNKMGFNNTAGIANVKQLLTSYMPQFYMSNPVIDYRPTSPVRYEIYKSLRSSYYSGGNSQTFNLTISKSIIQFDTSVNPQNQRPSFDSYQIDFRPGAYAYQINDNTDISYQLNFVAEDMYNLYVIKKIKVNQIFGIVGGCIAFLFLGLGCLPRSYNQFKMRYIIGTRLYTIMGLKKKYKTQKIKGSKIKSSSSLIQFEYQQLTQCELIYAWLLSYWKFLTKQFNDNPILKRYYLIQSRVSQDINIYQFMKNLYACQSSLNKTFQQIIDVNLCRVYPKQIISIFDHGRLQSNVEQSSNLKKQVKRQKYLLQATKINKFNEWELKVLLQAKQQQLDASEFFNVQWLDQYLGSKRRNSSHTGTNSQMNQSQIPIGQKQFKITRAIKEQQSSDANLNLALEDKNADKKIEQMSIQ